MAMTRLQAMDASLSRTKLLCEHPLPWKMPVFALVKGSHATPKVSESLPSSLKTAKLFRQVTSNTTTLY